MSKHARTAIVQVESSIRGDSLASLLYTISTVHHHLTSYKMGQEQSTLAQRSAQDPDAVEWVPLVPSDVQCRLYESNLNPEKRVFIAGAHKHDEVCPICHDEISDASLLIQELGFQHTFCVECFLESMTTRVRFPMCDCVIKQNQLHRRLLPDRLPLTPIPANQPLRLSDFFFRCSSPSSHYTSEYSRRGPRQ